MRFIHLILLISICYSCIQHGNNEAEISVNNALKTEKQLTVKYAKGFEIQYATDYITVITKSFGANVAFRDSVVIPLNSQTKFPSTTKILNPTINSVACQSSTHLAFINELDKIDLVQGVCGLKYVQNKQLTKKLEENKATELCMGEGIVVETLLNINPDLLLLYPFGNDFNQAYEKSGVTTLLIAEYLEESQLARVEWIKLFGVLLGKAKLANDYFEAVEKRYIQLKNDVIPSTKTFIMNVPFDDNWYMPSANSVGVKLIEDAGLRYFYETDKGTENNLRAKEQVWEHGTEADYWIIVASRKPNFTLSDLVAEAAVYGTFKAVKDRNVIFCNTSTVDYFAQGTIEPDVILEDLLFATGKIQHHEPRYFFRLAD